MASDEMIMGGILCTFYEALKSMHVVEMLALGMSCYVAKLTRLGR